MALDGGSSLLDELKEIDEIGEFISKKEKAFNYDNFKKNFANQIKNTLEKDISEFTTKEVLNFDDEKLNKFISYLIYLELTRKKDLEEEGRRNAIVIKAKPLTNGVKEEVEEKEENELLKKAKSIIDEMVNNNENKSTELKEIFNSLDKNEIFKLYNYTIETINPNTNFLTIYKKKIFIIDSIFVKEIYFYTFFQDNGNIISKNELQELKSSYKKIFKLLHIKGILINNFINKYFKNSENIETFIKYIPWIMKDIEIGISSNYKYYFKLLEKYIFKFDNKSEDHNDDLNKIFSNNQSANHFLNMKLRDGTLDSLPTENKKAK